MTTYQFIQVLDRQNNAREMPSDTFSRSVFSRDPHVGKRSFRTRDVGSKVLHPYLWTCKNRGEICDLKNWFNDRKGRLRPIWIPTWRQDLILAQDVVATDPGILIQACGYTKHSFPQHGRRHLAFHWPDRATAFRQVLNSFDNGTTESLGLDSALGRSLPAGAWVSYLSLCRLVSDDLEIVYITSEVAEAHLTFIEVPQEAP